MKTYIHWLVLASLAIDAAAAAGGEAVRERADIDSPRLTALAEALKSNPSGALEVFWSEMKGRSPLIEPIEGDKRHLRVTFIWRADGETKTVLLRGGLPAANPLKPLSHLGDSDIWYRTEQLPKTARLSYSFLVNAPPEPPSRIVDGLAWLVRYPPRVDAFNPNKLSMSGPLSSIGASVLELPDAPPQPWIKARPEVPRGTVKDQSVDSTIFGRRRDLVVYTPAGYGDVASRCCLLIVFDADIYAPAGASTIIPTPTILDNLIAQAKIPPTVAVFIKNPNVLSRLDELACSPKFADFVANELVSWVRGHYRVSDDPGRTVTCGASLGGLCAAYCGFRHPDVIGNVLSQSGSFLIEPGYVWRCPTYDVESGWLARQFAKTTRRPLRFYLEVGRFERSYEGDSVLEHRRFRDVLEAKGYPVVYSEYDGEHDFCCWRGSLADGLISLLGGVKRE
jgi:enterochelin esterase family protein